MAASWAIELRYVVNEPGNQECESPNGISEQTDKSGVQSELHPESKWVPAAS